MQSYLGTNSIGASSQAMASSTSYVKRVSVPANSVVATVEGYLRLTADEVIGWRVGLWADNAGVPGMLLALWTPRVDSINIGGTDRWLGGPIGRWFDSATDVWVGVHAFDPGTTTLAFVSGTGSDRTIATGGTWTGEPGASGTSVVNTGHDFSIRASVVS